MSPIAIASARASIDQTVKGTGRRINAIVRHPPIFDLLSTTGTIESLAAMRAQIIASIETGEIAPSRKTQERWSEAIWVRVLELMALQPRQAPYIYNVTLRWPKPAALQAALEAQMQLVTAAVPPAGTSN